MATVNEKMTALTDEVRTLSGTTNKMGLDTITNNLNEVNTEVASQTELIEQIATALEGKASGNTNIKLQSKNVIPNSSELIITADSNFDGLKEVIIQGDNDLIPENIKDGVNIFGVQGNLSASGGGSSNLGEKIITSNGEYYAEDDGYDGYNYIDVSVTADAALVTFDVSDLPDGKTIIVQFLDSYLSSYDAAFDNSLPPEECVIEVAGGSIIAIYCSEDAEEYNIYCESDDDNIFLYFQERLKIHIARINGDGIIYVS